MDSERWQRVEQLFYSVLAEPVERRAAVLEASCSNDPELLQELKSLLEAREDVGSFLSPEERRDYIIDLCQDAAGYFRRAALSVLTRFLIGSALALWARYIGRATPGSTGW